MSNTYEARPTIPLTALQLDRATPDDARHLLDALRLGDADACAQAARQLSAPIDGWLLDTLLDALGDANMAVRVAAASALGELRAPEAIAPLIGLLKNLSLPDYVRWAAAQAIRAIKGMASPASPSQPPVAETTPPPAPAGSASERITTELPAVKEVPTTPTSQLSPAVPAIMPAARPAAQRHSRLRRWLIASLLAITVAVAGYVLGGVYISSHISAAYTGADCATVVELASAALPFYPSAIAPWASAATSKAAECQQLLDARAKQTAQDWPAAYLAFSKFLEDHPATPFGALVRTQLAEVVFAWGAQLQHDGSYQAALDTFARLQDPEQAVRRYQAEADTYAAWAERSATDGDYEKALAKLKTVLQTYADSSAAPAAGKRIIQLYNDWATQLRKQAQYPAAEQAYTKLIKWVSDHHDQAALSAAQAQQAQLYIEWSAALQQQGDFAAALSRLQLAQQSSDAGVAARAHASMVSLHSAWADALLKERQYDDAIEQLRAAAELLAKGDAQQLAAAQARLVNAYLAWSAALRASSEFQHALDRIAQARAVPATPALAASVSQAEAQTIDAFAHSPGREARDVMQQAIAAACDDQQGANSPLIARDASPKQVAAYQLPIDLRDSSIVAATPAALHYVACTETRQERIETCQYSFSDPTIGPGWIIRETIAWVITLRDVKTGAVVAQQTFAGGQPAACQAHEVFSTGAMTQERIGTAPTLEQIEAWLKSFVS